MFKEDELSLKNKEVNPESTEELTNEERKEWRFFRHDSEVIEYYSKIKNSNFLKRDEFDDISAEEFKKQHPNLEWKLKRIKELEDKSDVEFLPEGK